MKNIKINKETVGKFAKNSCKFALCTLAIVLPHLSKKDTIDMIRYSGDVSYSDVVEAIMSSCMWSGDKRAAVELLSKEADMETYKAVIKIARSNLYSGDKVEMIRNICSEK